MVTIETLQSAQATLTNELEKRFDGDVYFGVIENPYFIIDFFARDRGVVTNADVREYLDGVVISVDEESYRVSVSENPEMRYKYTYILTVSKVQDNDE